MFTEHDQFTRNKSKPLSAPLKVWPLKNETAKQQPSALRTGQKITGLGGKLKKKKEHSFPSESNNLMT